jgi:hypothetical protein
MKPLLPIVIYLVLLSSWTYGQSQSQPYDYPVRPGTVEWEKLNSFEEHRNAYNIPLQMLANMSTEHLVQTCLAYPDFMLMMSRNSIQQGYDYLKTIFNGFAELEQREDAACELLKFYQALNPSEIIKYETPIERGKFSFRFTFTEVLLAQESILQNMDIATERELIKQCLSHHEAMVNMPEQYASFNLMTPAFVLGRILKVRSNEMFQDAFSTRRDVHDFVERSTVYSASTVPSIILQAQVYLKSIENE